MTLCVLQLLLTFKPIFYIYVSIMIAFIEKIRQNLEVIDFATKNTDKLLTFLWDVEEHNAPHLFRKFVKLFYIIFNFVVRYTSPPKVLRDLFSGSFGKLLCLGNYYNQISFTHQRYTIIINISCEAFIYALATITIRSPSHIRGILSL